MKTEIRHKAMSDYREFRQCQLKVTFDGKRKAKDAIQVMRRNRKLAHGSTLCAYRCPHCNSWHIGNDKKNRNEIAVIRARELKTRPIKPEHMPLA